VVVEADRVGQIADPPLDREWFARRIEAEHARGAARDLGQPEQHQDGGRLPGAIGTQDAEGFAAAEQVELSGTAPNGWKVTFEPKSIDSIAPGQTREAQALVTPSEKAIAGDYATTLRAASKGENATANFRVAVTTSTMWGMAGFGIIGVALLVLVGAVARFGRR
jgi:hypothetical protein